MPKFITENERAATNPADRFLVGIFRWLFFRGHVMEFKVVEVAWLDAWIDTNDLTLKKAKKLKPIARSTIGYLIADKKDCIVLSTDRFHKEKEINAPMVIPKGMILEYWEYEIIS